jgi:hypothetical protein
MRLPSRSSVPRGSAGVAAIVGVASLAGAALFAGSATAADPPTEQPLAVERFNYPGSKDILNSHKVNLISGDGHIVLADCAAAPTGDIGLIKARTTDISVGKNGLICFKVIGRTGRLDLEMPAVYEIRGDGLKPGAGHKITADVKTDEGQHTKVTVDPSGSTPVGIGIDPENPPTALVQLVVTG